MSSEMEDVAFNEDDTDDELDWEEVQFPEHQHPQAEEALEITLEAQPKTQKSNKLVMTFTFKTDAHLQQEEGYILCRKVATD